MLLFYKTKIIQVNSFSFNGLTFSVNDDRKRLLTVMGIDGQNKIDFNDDEYLYWTHWKWIPLCVVVRTYGPNLFS